MHLLCLLLFAGSTLSKLHVCDVKKGTPTHRRNQFCYLRPPHGCLGFVFYIWTYFWFAALFFNKECTTTSLWAMSIHCDVTKGAYTSTTPLPGWWLPIRDSFHLPRLHFFCSLKNLQAPTWWQFYFSRKQKHLLLLVAVNRELNKLFCTV